MQASFKNVIHEDFPVGRYRHHKGQEYEVIGVALHSETLEKLVMYRRLNERDIWVRPLSMFQEVVDGVPRFQLIEAI